ncbi:MAG: bis(5'-nucleosyl)-tetraphosphatase [Candidatus Ranarchaeia archaeon]
MREQRSSGVIVYRYNLQHRREYLLLQHSANGHWSFPKGLIEGAETDISAALREVEEETRLAPSEIQIEEGFKEEIEYRYFFEGEQIHKRVTYFLGLTKARPGSVKISCEHRDVKWLNYEKALKKVKYSNTRKLLVKAENFLRRKYNCKN